MARNGKTQGNGHGTDAQKSLVAEAAVDTTPEMIWGVDATRVAIRTSLASARRFIDWSIHLEQQQSKSLSAWRHAFDSALHEAGRAGDLQSLALVPAKLASQQMGLAIEGLGEGLALWLESEVQLAKRLGNDSAALVQKMLPDSAAGAARGRSDDGSALAQFGRLQDQWLATTQRWIDAAGAVVNPESAR